MAANTSPRYTLTGDYSNNSTQTSSATFAGTLLTATGDFTGISTNHKLVFTSGTNGSRIVGIHFESIGTNVQSVVHIFVNNGGSQTTATNNVLVGQLTLPATTTSTTAAVGSADFYFPGPSGYADLPPGFTLWAGLGTTVAAGWVASPILGSEF